jgi:putative tricarboxylic transport membrane protein
MSIIKYAAALLLAAHAGTALAAEFVPNRRVEIVVHTGPGGGADLMARALQTMLDKEKLLPVGTEVVNKPGPTGAAAMGYLAQKKGDGNVIGVFTSTYMIDPILNPQAPITWKALTPLARLLVEPAIILVRPESPYKTFADFINDAKARPGQLIQAGGAFGAATILKMLLEKDSGTKWGYVPFPTGGERVAALLGGHAQLLILEAAEGVKYVQGNQMRALAVAYTDVRLPGFPDVPTLKELGFADVGTIPQNRGILGPPGISPEVIAYWDGVFSKLVQTQSWKEYIEKNQMQSAFQPRNTLTTFLEGYTKDVRDILETNGIKVVK